MLIFVSEKSAITFGEGCMCVGIFLDAILVTLGQGHALTEALNILPYPS